MMGSLLDAAENMLLCGAEITRVEDTLGRLAAAYGAVKADVFVITSSIVLTLTFEDGEMRTAQRRIGRDGGTDFEKFEKLNALSRECCGENGPIETEEFCSRIEAIKSEKNSAIKGLLGNVLAAGSLAIFFGGSLMDGLLAGVMGALVWVLTEYLAKLLPNKLTFSLICSLLVGITVCLIENLTMFFKVDKVIIGVIMLLIPGIAITNAVRDMLTGNTISGALRFIKSALLAFMIAAGFMLAIQLTGAPAAHTAVTDGVYQLIPALVSSLGFGMLFNLRYKYLPFVAVGGLCCWGLYLICETGFGLGVFWCSLFAGFFADFLSQVLARILKTPATLFLVPTFVPLIPGSALYYASYFLVTKDFGQLGHYALITALVVLGISLGVGFSAGIFSVAGKFGKNKTERKF